MGVKVAEKVKGSGVWWIIINHRGRRKYVRGGSREAAKAAAKKIEEGLATGAVNLNPPEPAITFREYAEKWYAGHVCVNLKPSSHRGARRVLDLNLLPEFGDKPLDSITRDDIKEFSYRMLKEGRVKTKKLPDGTITKKLARSSVAGMIATFSSIFNSAREDGMISSSNPAERKGKFLKGGGLPKREIEILTQEEGEIFLQAAKTHAPRHYALFYTALITGMRAGELIGLQWGDIDWNGRFIDVRRSIWEGHITTPKNGKARRVDMADELASILSDHRRNVAAESLKNGRPLPEWVFPSEAGTHFDGTNLLKAFTRVLKKAGLRRIVFHNARHCFGTWLVGAGESLDYVKRQMGHSSISVTVDIYGAHVPPGTGREAVNRLAARLGKSAPPARLDPSVAKEASPVGEDNMPDLKEITGAGGRD